MRDNRADIFATGSDISGTNFLPNIPHIVK